MILCSPGSVFQTINRSVGEEEQFTSGCVIHTDYPDNIWIGIIGIRRFKMRVNAETDFNPKAFLEVWGLSMTDILEMYLHDNLFDQFIMMDQTGLLPLSRNWPISYFIFFIISFISIRPSWGYHL